MRLKTLLTTLLVVFPLAGMAQVTLDCLDWQLDDNHAAVRSFTGKACRLCVDPTGTIQRKGL